MHYFLIISVLLMPIVVPIPGILYRRARSRSGDLLAREAWPEIRNYYQLFGMGLGLTLICEFALLGWSESEAVQDLFGRLIGIGVFALIGAVYLCPIWVRRLRRTERRIRVEWLNRCRHCDYDLTDNLTCICSECGQPREQLAMPVWLNVFECREKMQAATDELSLTWLQRKLSASPDKFAHMVIKELRKQFPECSATYDAERFLLNVELGKKHKEFPLKDDYYFFASCPFLFASSMVKVDAENIGRTITEGQDLPKHFEDARAGLIPKFFPRVQLELTNTERQLKGEPLVSLPSREFGEYFHLWLRYESDAFRGYVKETDLRRWGVSLDDALPIAHDNLRLLCDGAFKEIAPGVYKSPGKDCYDAARIMLPDQIRELSVDGDHIALIVDKFELLVTGSESLIGIVELAKALKRMDMYSFSYDGGPLILDGDTWRPFEPSGWHPAAIALRNLHCARRMEAYRSQAEVMAELLVQEGSNTAVAQVKTEIDDVTGERILVAFWPDGEFVSLPEVDRIQFDGRGLGLAQTIALDWDEVCAHFFDLMVVQVLHPPRWLMCRADVEQRLRADFD